MKVSIATKVETTITKFVIGDLYTNRSTGRVVIISAIQANKIDALTLYHPSFTTRKVMKNLKRSDYISFVGVLALDTRTKN